MWLRDTGILSKLRALELDAPVAIPYPKVRVDQPLNFYQLGSAFLAFIMGLIISIAVFLAELKLKRRKVHAPELSLELDDFMANRGPPFHKQFRISKEASQ